MNACLFWAILSGFLAWAAALRANWHTMLRGALLWAGLAIAAWSAAAGTCSSVWGFVAVALTGCAGVAVLGARRPGAAAWNFVVVGLLLVLLVPLAEAAALGTTVQLDTVRTVFMTALIGTVSMNYVPTRCGISALLAAAGSLGALWSHGGATWPIACIAAVPWTAWAAWRLPRRSIEFDRYWLAFRDRFGAIWGLRVREQFNRSAANSGWPIELGWRGLRGEPSPEALGVLKALTSRFGAASDQNPGLPP